MRRPIIVFMMMLTTVFFFYQTASAQFPKLPKILKPPPTPTDTTQPSPQSGTEQPKAVASAGSAPRSGGPYAVKPEPPLEPQFLAETLDIGLEHWEYYWKIPNDNHNTSWVPRIRFFVFYGGSAKQRFKAEYTMPDGSPWFSEALEFRGDFGSDGTSLVQSASESDRDKKSIVVGGIFGIKITNIRDNSTVFQGKFKIGRYKPQNTDARYKNEVDYYVDYDWKLPIGFTDLEFGRALATPFIHMWFKGDINGDNLEARLFYNGQQIATTDDGGGVGHGEDHYADKRGDDKYLFWREFRFSWPKSIGFDVKDEIASYADVKEMRLINHIPGDYVVKVFYNGEQVRETKFSIGTNGTYADNGIAKQSNISTNKIFLSVKVMGTLDKWNPANAKGFYGNPVVGIP